MNAVPDEIDDMLRDAGIRVTQQRRTVIAALVQSHDHPSAHDVYARAKLVDNSVSFATVYRALATLADAGIVHRIAVDDGPARFEMAPETEHDHLVDVDSGEVLELASKELVAVKSRLAAELGYEILSQHSVLRVRKLKRTLSDKTT
jgi:Fur family ferric uptake transcriptional regulator